MSSSSRLRCAIYTRKSSEEGLDQEFNPLDAQREACASYIASQASLGWKLNPTFYDDGGISGGTMERPALKQLLNDIKQGHVDVVVVYKIDRLTRSLMDFAKMVDVFDDKNVSFVSVTQQFNTTTSMGRLTLNVLLSFAQFEREVTAERIRDKIAASKKKGMWMGGSIPLGYKTENKKLLINEQEAETVRWLFERYLELGSVKQLSDEARQSGLKYRTSIQKNGKIRKTKAYGRGSLYHLLSNPVYIGKIRHQDNIYDGEHQPIIDQALWDAVQVRMTSNTHQRQSSTNEVSTSILTGLIFDETGDRLTPTHANKKGIRYHYYCSNRLLNKSTKQDDGWRLPAREIEQPVLRIISHTLINPLKLTELISLGNHSIDNRSGKNYSFRDHSIEGSSTKDFPIEDCSIIEQQRQINVAKELADNLNNPNNNQQKQILASFIHRVEITPTQIAIEINIEKLQSVLSGTEEQISSSLNTPISNDTSETTTLPPSINRITINHQLRKRGVEAKLVLTDGNIQTPNPDKNLIKLIAKAHLWFTKLTDGTAISISDLAKQQNEDPAEISRFLPLAFLAPSIIDNILAGTQPVDLTIEKLRRIPALPILWSEQRDALGFTG